MNLPEITCQRVEEFCAAYDGPLYHALLCDPPYHLTSITDRFGKEGSAPAKDRDGAFQRASRGFMGKVWDGGGTSFRPETWAALGSLLHPGAFGFAFASSRGWHRMAVAIEDAGFILHPSVFLYAFGSGFPKATRLDRAIDANEYLGKTNSRSLKQTDQDVREQIGTRREANRNNGFKREPDGTVDLPITAPATELAKVWAGHRYGLQSLKPAVEPVILFQRPYAGRPVDSITSTGAGAINIDGARVGTEPVKTNGWKCGGEQVWGGGKGICSEGYRGEERSGRWPANLALQHQPTCGSVCDPSCAVAELDRQSGVLKSGALKPYRENHQTASSYRFEREKTYTKDADTGTASRYFYNADWNLEVEERLAQAVPVRYCAKPSRAERDAGCERLPMQTRNRVNPGGLENDPRWAPVEAKNVHPTVKAIALTRWLATLLLPPAAYAPRRLLQPFSGSGSEAIGAMLAGWECVTGIEAEAEYVEIARARIAWHAARHARQPGLFDEEEAE